ncbi:amidase [Planococcus koreensis]|uniref:amidase n=1 Tax=Planococcus koreensis TaxID=112331 RepID=UPI0039FCA015
MENVLNLSITELAALYRQKQVSPVEVVKLSFERQEKIGKALNAFITVAEDSALRQAKKAEEAFLANKPSHLLAGIPYSAKDLFYTEGIRTTCASPILKDFVPDYNATVVSKLDAAGAVMLGKTNMLEFAYGIVHPDYGKTNNPWDLSKTSGGSSGGSAAAVASGIGYFSLGSDTGGSIRIPASYCGVAGLKPTRGLVSLHGVFPLSGSLDHAGPIARNALDAALVLEVIAGFDPQDPHSLTGGSGEVDISNFSALDAKHVGVLPERLLRGLTPDVARVYKETLQHVRSLGWHIDEVEIEGWARMEDIIMAVLLPEAAQIHQQWLGRKRNTQV